jgi:hypothetical protein
MIKNLEDLRLDYGVHTINVKCRAAGYADSNFSSPITYNSQPRISIAGKTLTVHNLSKKSGGVIVYFNNLPVKRVEYAGALEQTGILDIDLSDVEVDDGDYSVFASVIEPDKNTDTNTLLYTQEKYRAIFADNTWADIIAASEEDKIPATWKEGDEKEVELTTGETIVLQILGFKHDDLADGSGKAGIALFMKDCLATAYNMNSSNTITGGWRDSDMRERMSTFLSYLPIELRNGIKTVNKKTALQTGDSTIITTEDKLFLLSQMEILGTNYRSSDSQRSYPGEGEQYEYFKKASIPYSHAALSGTTGTTIATGGSYTNRFNQSMSPNRLEYFNYNDVKGLGNSATSATCYWLRSPSCQDKSFCIVYADGTVRSDCANYNYGLAFGLCV